MPIINTGCPVLQRYGKSFILTEDYMYRDLEGNCWFVPAGFETDLAQRIRADRRPLSCRQPAYDSFCSTTGDASASRIPTGFGGGSGGAGTMLQFYMILATVIMALFA